MSRSNGSAFGSGLRRRSAGGDYDRRVGLNMTPMVDVVMVILIFFMASAAMLGPEWMVATRLPKKASVATASTEQPLRMTITLSRSPQGTQYRLSESSSNTAITFQRDEALAAIRRALGTKSPAQVVVLIDPAADVAYEDVVIVHAACLQLGVSKVGLKETAAGE